MKKLISLLLVVSLMITLVVPASAANYECFPKCSPSYTSIADALVSIGEDGSYSYRQKIAAANGISNYTGQANENIFLLGKLKDGSLVKPGGNQTSNQTQSANPEKLYMLETTVNTTIREKASQNSAVQAKVSAGTLLTCVSSTTNQYGNVWYSVIDPGTGETGFIYSGKVRLHECSFSAVSSKTELSFCRCGKIRCDNVSTGVVPTYSMALPLEDLISLDVIRKVVIGFGSTLKATAGTAMSYVAPCVPYILVTVAFGVTVYTLVQVSEYSVIVDDVEADYRKLDADFKPDAGVYYNGKIDGNFFAIDVAHPMDKYMAIDVLDFQTSHYQVWGNGSWFIYTVEDSTADELIKDYLKIRPFYQCNYIKDGHATGDLMKQFKHYHITPINCPQMHLGGHVMFDAPMLGTFSGGKWA